MARKTLLTESEIRQFMKLANLGPLGDAKIEEMYGKAHDRDEDEKMKKEGEEGEETLEEDEDIDEGQRSGGAMNRDGEGRGDEHDKKKKHMKEEEELDEMGQPAVMDRDEDDEPMDGDIDLASAGDEMGGMDDGEREELMADVVRAVAQALGIEDQVSVEAGEDDGMEGGDMDAMPEPADEPPMELGDDDDEDLDDRMMEEEELEEANEDDLVAEVAKRVADRLKVESRKEKLVDELAERIIKRLSK